MFFIAMHLMYKKRQDPNLELPNQVPAELAASAGDAADQPRLSTGPGGINIG